MKKTLLLLLTFVFFPALSAPLEPDCESIQNAIDRYECQKQRRAAARLLTPSYRARQAAEKDRNAAPKATAIQKSEPVVELWGNSPPQKKHKEKDDVRSTTGRFFGSQVCHIGPRGGRYTISPSGHKRYNC